jgi:nucleotide-binding universal stress UspA family protein
VQAPSLERVVVGVDGSDASFEACRQAAWIAPPEAAFEVVSVVHLADADKVGWRAPTARDELRLDAEQALETAVATLAAAGRASTPVFVNGFVTDALLRHVETTSADLLVVGSHGRSRLEAILIGSVAGDVLHRARCSVLVTRPRDAAPGRTVVLGDDATPPARVAAQVAGGIAERLGLPLHAVTAADHPVRTLVASLTGGDLLVVGSRQLTGVRAVASVSERVAHQAPCSVLVVRADSA